MIRSDISLTHGREQDIRMCGGVQTRDPLCEKMRDGGYLLIGYQGVRVRVLGLGLEVMILGTLFPRTVGLCTHTGQR